MVKRSTGSKVDVNAYPFWSPRFWHGMRTACWWRLLAKNRFRIAPSRLSIVVGVSAFTPFNDLLACAQHLVHGRRIARTEIQHPPIFILGHWRSGTTLLHELMVTDPRFASPNTFQCFAPWHFILSQPLMIRLGGFLLPKQRPMDNMPAGWQLPQEDEFALMNLGVPSPYLKIAFPQTQCPALSYLNMVDLSESELQTWRQNFLWFLRALTYHYSGQQLVLKSPPHTGRIAELSNLFPGSKFIHLTRNPQELFASTMRLWKSLYAVQALQPSPSDTELKDYVTQCLTHMYGEFETARQSIASDRLVDVRYEDLVADPVGTLRGLYEQLGLPGQEEIPARLADRLRDHQSYRANAHNVDTAHQVEIQERWSGYAERYDY